MIVLHSGSLDMRSGGPATSTYLTLKGLEACGVATRMLTPPCERKNLVAQDAKCCFTPPMRWKRWGYMPGLPELLQDLGKMDLYHVQGLWQYLGHGLAVHARKTGVPYIVTLRGMLYPQALQHSAWVKKLALRLYQRRDLQRAACIHVTCEEEMVHYRELGFTNPVAVIPNPVKEVGMCQGDGRTREKKCVGYLGRVHPRKRIERLIYAFDALREETRDWELWIIGADDLRYERFLRSEVKRLGLTNVQFTGFLAGAAREDVMQSLSYLMLPSDFENFGMVVAEALARGIPVIVSKGAPWQDLETEHCGWWISNDQISINKALGHVLTLSEEERTLMGKNGIRLIREKYSVEAVGVKMMQLYDWILGRCEKPEFVYE